MLVASNLSTPNDLAHLCITSSRFLRILRPFLYRNVKIKAVGSRSNGTHLFTLLAHDKSLAKCVVELTLERFSPPYNRYDRTSLVNPDALVNMVSLKHVVLYGTVFSDVYDQIDFGRALANISLDELTYTADSQDDMLPTDRMEDIGGLKKLYWNSRIRQRTCICAIDPHFLITLFNRCWIRFNRCELLAYVEYFISFRHNDPHALSSRRLLHR
jgi:hypothetical protein